MPKTTVNISKLILIFTVSVFSRSNEQEPAKDKEEKLAHASDLLVHHQSQQVDQRDQRKVLVFVWQEEL